MDQTKSGHLSLEQMEKSVYEDWETEEDRTATQAHLKDCKICRSRIERERERNPLYRLYLEAPDKEAFWRQVDKIAAEVRDGKKTE